MTAPAAAVKVRPYQLYCSKR